METNTARYLVNAESEKRGGKGRGEERRGMGRKGEEARRGVKV